MKPENASLLVLSLLKAVLLPASAAILRFDFNQPGAWPEATTPVGTEKSAFATPAKAL